MNTGAGSVVWMVAAGGGVSAPMSAAELRQLGEAGGIPADAMVWRTGLAAWAPASTVRGLALTPPAPAFTVRSAPEYRRRSPYAPLGTLAMVVLGVAIGGFLAIEGAKQYAMHQVASVVRASGEKFAAGMEQTAAEWRQQHDEFQQTLGKASSAVEAARAAVR